jgi:uncharacterized damage-inducible protein DinB
MGDTILRELVYGKGAHADPVACIEDISAKLAARIVAGSPHSIWQIVEHMNYWMEFDLGKVAGQDRPYPQRAMESWSTDANPAGGSSVADDAWKATTRRFADMLARLTRLAESDERELERVVHHVDSAGTPRDSTVHAMLWQITAHNSYHAGQIALLRRQAGAWPPERGGDTW